MEQRNGGRSAAGVPVALTTFVGRQREMAEVRRGLAVSRLVTLTGPGGVGKTRLAMQIGAELDPDHADGAWFAELAAVTDAHAVGLTIASTLGLRHVTAEGVSGVLVSYLGERELLLVVDNCEHLVDECAHLLAELLRRCPGLTVLTTSRTVLGIAGETVIAVPPLSVAAGGNGPWGPQFRGIGSLSDAGVLGDDMLFIHCCTSGDDELRMLADSGAAASVAAAVEAVLPGLGAPATGRLLKFGIRPSLSIDTEASVAGDMFNVMRAALTSHGLGVTLAPDAYSQLPAFTPVDLLEFATIRGAEASGLADRTGSITPGKDADVILVRLDELTMLPTTDIAASIVGAGAPASVDTVLVAGRVLKWQGRIVHLDLDRIRHDLEASRDRLLATPLAEG